MLHHQLYVQRNMSEYLGGIWLFMRTTADSHVDYFGAFLAFIRSLKLKRSWDNMQYRFSHTDHCNYMLHATDH